MSRLLAVACASVVVSVAGCGSEAGGAHLQAGKIPAVQPADAPDPHGVARDATASAYCLACHVGYDGAGSHRVGVSLADAAARLPGELVSPPGDPALVLVGGLVECSTCHDDGSAGFPYRTVAEGFALCMGCHAF